MSVIGSALVLAAIVANGSFEEGKAPLADGWGADGRVWRVVEGAGINATRAMKWENSDPAKYVLLGQEIKLKPGMKYHFSGMVKTEGTSGPGWSGAMVIVDWCDKDGKWIGEWPTRKRIEGDNDWTFLEGWTPSMPNNAAKFHVLCCVTKGSTGKVYFDDIRVEEVSQRPIEGVYTSAYRNEVADEDGEITFFANLFLDPETKDLEKWTAEFIFQTDERFVTGQDDRFIRRFRADTLTTQLATLKVPLSKLLHGVQPVAFEIVSPDGKIRDSATLTLDYRETHRKLRVRVDRYGRILLDGRPYFPLGFYCGGLDDEQVAFLKRGPFNAVIDYAPLRREVLDRCAKAGIMVVGNLKNYDKHTNEKHSWVKGAWNLDMPEVFCSTLVRRFRNHPAILGWYVNDEIPATEKARMARRRDFLERIDPDHPAYSVIYQIPEVREHRSTCDILGTDPYPIHDNRFSICSEWAEATKAAQHGGPIWQVFQAFDYEWFLGKEDPKRGWPTKAEVRSMMWQPIACGANGLFGYAFHQFWKNLDGAKREEFFAPYCETAREIVKHVPGILSSEPAPAIESGLKPQLRARTWSLGGKGYLLVCNTDHDQPVETVLRVAGRAVAVKLPPVGVEIVEL